MEPRGYQLIENKFTSDVIHQTPLEWHIPLFMWLVDILNKDIVTLYPIEIELIAAKYILPYPCIAVHCLNGNPENLDIAPVFIKKIEEIHNTASFLNFNKYIVENQDQIKKEVARFKELYAL